MINLNKFENLIQGVERDEKLFYTFLSLILVFLLWWLIKIEMGLLGFICLLFYFFIVGVWLGNILRQVARISDFWSFILGIFLAIYLTGFGLAFWIVFYKLTLGLMMVTLVGIAAAASVLERWGNREPGTRNRGWKLMFEEGIEGGEKFKDSLVKIKRGWWIGVGFLGLIALNILYSARTGEYILSPWEVISPLYIYFFIGLSFFCLLVIFSGCRLRVIFLVIILHSFLLHSYLPIVYETGFEGDKWRHIAAEKWLDKGKVYSPSLFGEEKVPMVGSGLLKIPEVFFVGNKTSYANQWGLTILLGRAMHVDFFKVDFLLGFILWSIFVPLFLFRLGEFFSKDRIFLGLLAFSPSLFYPLQVYGAVTLPVAFGFLYFIFALILWLTYLERGIANNNIFSDTRSQMRTNVTNETNRDKNFLILLIILTLLMYFNYLIYLVLILMIGLLIVYFKKFILVNLFNGGKPSRKILKYFLVSVLVFLGIIPILDRIGGASHFKEGDLIRFWNLPLNVLEFVLGKLLALSQFVPRPTFISQGNFIFMQIGKSLSGATLFRFINWPAVVSIFIWGAVIYGVIKIGKAKSFRIMLLWILILVILIFDHFVSMYYMEGVRLLTKRFDLTIAFFMLMIFSFGVYQWIVKESRIVSGRAKILTVSLVLAVFSSVVYASGPKLEVVTKGEVSAAEYVWNETQKHKNTKTQKQIGDERYCVLANTWPLLAVEMVSGREIVGGGFPTYLDYAQPERVGLWEKMTRLPAFRYMEKAKEITGADFCYLMVEKRWLGTTEKEQEAVFERLVGMFGDFQRIGDVYIFLYDL